jgi:hypothetical protein
VVGTVAGLLTAIAVVIALAVKGQGEKQYVSVATGGFTFGFIVVALSKVMISLVTLFRGLKNSSNLAAMGVSPASDSVSVSGANFQDSRQAGEGRN